MNVFVARLIYNAILQMWNKRDTEQWDSVNITLVCNKDLDISGINDSVMLLDMKRMSTELFGVGYDDFKFFVINPSNFSNNKMTILINGGFGENVKYYMREIEKRSYWI